MSREILAHLLENYTHLVARIDTHIQKVAQAFDAQIACKKGCDSCCRFLNLFPVEAFSLSMAFAELPETDQHQILNNLDSGQNRCPLLVRGICMTYRARPVICRTHGYPLYIEKEGQGLVDFCPKNFKGIQTFPKESLLDLEQLNTLLAAVNQHFLEAFETDLPERIPVSRALTLYREMIED